jgi:hypothetical protein
MHGDSCMTNVSDDIRKEAVALHTENHWRDVKVAKDRVDYSDLFCFWPNDIWIG